jgi:hypothetical protein
MVILFVAFSGSIRNLYTSDRILRVPWFGHSIHSDDAPIALGSER